MAKQIYIEKNHFMDSVRLMGISSRLVSRDNIDLAEIQMGTPANQSVIRSLGFMLPDDVGANDLIIALAGDSQEALDAASDELQRLMTQGSQSPDQRRYSSLDQIDLTDDPYDLVQISLPGPYAAAEANKALDLGLDVFIFSDNIPLADELQLKRKGCDRDLLVMGPDCGVGLLHGIALAAGSIVRPGPVGLVGASGSGAQEVACLIEKGGLGVSAIIGTGGRDLYPEIGGLTMLQGLKRMVDDPATEVIVLVSKLADRQVMDRVLSEADASPKPVVAIFLGADDSLYARHHVHAAFNLEDAATKAIELVTRKAVRLSRPQQVLAAIARQAVVSLHTDARYLRALYGGGTFAEESLLDLRRQLPDTVFYSNIKTSFAKRLDNHLVSQGHTILDLGSEDFTRDAPHPVFDPAIRLKRFEQELSDPDTAVLALDFITGPGVHPDPAAGFAAAMEKARTARTTTPVVVVSICGSQEDPQDINRMHATLQDAGAIVAGSNAESARIVAEILKILEGR
ncbi:MAG: hypothetical protein GX112_14875 [Clostridiaceae bacterium]|nr:hypothetical protein [Clostridiaceae bacterium]